MKQFNLTMTLLLLLGAITLPMSMSAQVSNDNEDEVYKIDQRMGKDFVPGQVLVKFKDATPVKVSNRAGQFLSTDRQTVNDVLKEFGAAKMEQLLPYENPKRKLNRSQAYNGETIQEHDLSQLYLVETDETHAHQTIQLVDQLKKLDAVEYAEPNYKVYITAEIAASFDSNPYTTQQWYLDNYGVIKLWNKKIINSKRPVIAIIDTGVDMTHPDLAPNLWTNTAEAEGEANYDNDGNGFAGDVHGWDFINNTPNVRDFNMHGTHVAGIAAAANNGIGIIGANPMALIMPVSVMQSDGTGDVATIVKGINYAIANGATILNLSLGTYANTRALRQALENAYQKAVIVAAAGNDALGIYPECGGPVCRPMFPAAYSFVLGVQATTSSGSLASFSNFDCDGPTYSAESSLQEPDGFNYELKAPGTEILSTIPGGKYKVLQGTSMAAPLVAGAISALKMVKQYDTQEILWGDLLHTDNIAQAYAVTNRPAELDLIKIMYRERKELADETEEDYSDDGEIDAGEKVSLYPVIRTTFGAASNIQMKLEVDEYEDPDLVTILTPDWVNFGLPLSAYAKGVSLNPMQLKVASNVADKRHIKMKFTAKCDETNTLYEGHFTMVVNNTVKINGLISEDRTLTADHVYYVNENLSVKENVTLTIEPGTTLEFAPRRGIKVDGTLIANGQPNNLIIMTCRDSQSDWAGITTASGTIIRYCLLEYFYNDHFSMPIFEDCIIRYMADAVYGRDFVRRNPEFRAIRSYIIDNQRLMGLSTIEGSHSNNICNNTLNDGTSAGYGAGETSWGIPSISKIPSSNYINNISDYQIHGKYYWLRAETTLESTEFPSYLGSSIESHIRPFIFEIGNAESFNKADLSNMLTRPIAEAHGIIWKVCVNGKDAQDEYEDLAPLGVGRHKFEVYFNRPMNKKVAPQITFGVRDPWTQNAVVEDGSWNEEGTIYTAYKTITGKTKSDGINRIHVRGAEDDEFFEIPYEKTRFNFMINAAGSMATGFAGEGKMGRVELTWNNEKNDFDDAMGFNIYRFSDSKLKTIPAHYDENNNWIEETQVPDTICINKEIVDIETTEYTDYDVVPGETYYYMYKVLSTDLKEYDVSNIVAVTPLTSSKGDANGDGNVNVADVTTSVNYIVGRNPKPFVFEAADLNEDQTIDVLDVVGLVYRLLHPSTASVSAFENAQEAIYTVENGILYIETPVALAGLQLQLSAEDDQTLTPASSLAGFEQSITWLSENDYQLLVYNIGSRELAPGKHAILNMGDAEITSLRLSDIRGGLVRVSAGENTTTIKDAMGSKVQNVKGVYNLNGQKITESSKLQRGVYIIDGQKIVK